MGEDSWGKVVAAGDDTRGTSIRTCFWRGFLIQMSEQCDKLVAALRLTCVRGHEKVPIGGQVAVPIGGQ